MVGKITTILAKKEAETYCSHGLHNEALDLYRKLLATSPNIDQDLKKAIENQIDRINSKLRAASGDEARRLSAADIKRVRKGWGENATQGDLLVCAQAFYQIGRHEDALVELAMLLKKGCAMERVTRIAADCLAQAHAPRKLVEAAGTFCRQAYQKQRQQELLCLILTEEMVKHMRLEHAKALFRQLQHSPYIKKKAPRRLAAIAKAAEGAEAHQQSIAPIESRPANADGDAPEAGKPAEPNQAAKKPFSFLLPFFRKRNAGQRDN